MQWGKAVSRLGAGRKHSARAVELIILLRRLLMIHRGVYERFK